MSSTQSQTCARRRLHVAQSCPNQLEIGPPTTHFMVRWTGVACTGRRRGPARPTPRLGRAALAVAQVVGDAAVLFQADPAVRGLAGGVGNSSSSSLYIVAIVAPMSRQSCFANLLELSPPISWMYLARRLITRNSGPSRRPLDHSPDPFSIYHSLSPSRACSMALSRDTLYLYTNCWAVD